MRPGGRPRIDSPCSPGLQSLSTQGAEPCAGWCRAESFSAFRVEFLLATEHTEASGAAVDAISVVAFLCEPFWRERDKTVRPIPG